MDNIEIITDNDIKLAEHAAVIRALGRRVVGDVIEIGRRLNDAQALCKEHGNLWLPWLKREFGWTESSAKRFMQVANKTPNLGDVDVPISGLYLLAQDSTPPTVIEAIAAKPKGKTIPLAEVKAMIAEAKKEAADKEREKAAAAAAKEQERIEKQIAKLTAKHTPTLRLSER
jgi:DUF3102 family protein